MKKSPLVPSDLLRLVTAADPQCSAAGSVYYVRAWCDGEADENRTAIWRTAPGDGATQFTQGPKDRLPRVNADGSALAFVGQRDQKKRVYVMSLAHGGEARAITPAYDAIGALAWSPDGTALAFTAKVMIDAADARI
ncbi:MAG: PD40 domain-containing protein, partial [Candidatus Eremiobacteraeota bacterium]|nr:PD40 domain-containing protein [Candidatus Eremiobacteraeota bacterium]